MGSVELSSGVGVRHGFEVKFPEVTPITRDSDWTDPFDETAWTLVIVNGLVGNRTRRSSIKPKARVTLI
jgi:hypothetical protein